MKHSIIVFFFLLYAGILCAQKTRENYFQQEVNYTISVKLDDEKHTLKGFETIQYINHSPHSLNHIYFHLWPNAYRNNKTAFAIQQMENGDEEFYFSDASEHYGYIDSLLFTVDNDTVKWEYDSAHIDICLLHLKKTLQPGDTIEIATPFFVKLPSSFSRLGHEGQSYQITQWYPKPAVYDNNGWNKMPYLNQGEFYSEFGSFDVSITLPRNYVVAATGDIQSPEEEKWLENRAKETKALIEQVRIDKSGRLNGTWDEKFPESSREWKTVRYKQKNVHDFAWFADKRFYVLRGEYNLPKSGRNVALYSYFLRSGSKYWVKSIQYLNDAIKYYSLWNGEYPYNVVSAVDGSLSAGGGMEYPTITIIGQVGSDHSLENVIMHEVGHNWFYGILGTNEREHPWMDEGLNTFNEMRYNETKYPELSLTGSFAPGQTGLNKFLHIEDITQRYQYQLTYFLQAARNADQPMEEKAQNFTPFNYAAVVYSKTGFEMDYLRHYLGEKVFDKCMHEYYERWKFKHPQPADLHQTFEDISKRDLDWFFSDMVNSNEVIDYKLVRKAKPERGSTKTNMWMKFEQGLIVNNKTGTIAPFVIQGIRGDTIAAEVWYDGFRGKKVVYFPNGPYEYFKIDYEHRTPDVNRNNNMLKEKGMCKRMERPLLQFGGTIDNGTRSIVNYLPVIGFNDYDGLMGGIALYNNFLPQKGFEWKIIPLFGFKSMQPAGMARFDVNINTRKSTLLNNINIFLSVQRFSIDVNNDAREGNFVKVNPGMEFRWKKNNYRSKTDRFIKLSSPAIMETEKSPDGWDGNGDLVYNDKSYINLYPEMSFTYLNGKKLTPWSLEANAQYGINSLSDSLQNDFLKASVTWHYKWIYNAKGNAVSFRVFAGKFIFNNTISARYSWRMDGQHGYHDYSYSSVFPARFETEKMFSHQFIENHGAIKIPTANGQSIDWLASVNVKADLPVPVIKTFADFGISQNPGADVSVVYDAGFYFTFFKGFSDVYIPVFMSKNVQDEYDANNFNFAYRIRFTFNLQNLAPSQLIKKIPF